MTVTKKFSAEGLTSGTTIVASSTAGTGDTAFDLVSTPGSGSATIDSGSAVHGSNGVKVVATSGNQGLLRWNGFNGSTGVARTYMKTVISPASGTESVLAFYTITSNALCLTVGVNLNGKYSVQGVGSSTIALSTSSAVAGDRLEIAFTVGTSSSNGAVDFYLYRGDSATATEHLSSTTANLGTTNWDRVQACKTSTSTFAGTYEIDDLAVASGTTTLFGVPASPPTAAFTFSSAGYEGNFNASTSTAVSPATITGYAWTFGDGVGTSTSENPSYDYTTAGPGTYTVTLTVTDSNGLTNPVSHSITITAPTGNAGVASVPLSTGWTPSSGTALSVLTDGSASSYITSSTNPSALELDVIPTPMTAPPSGFDAAVGLLADFQAGTSASYVAKLYKSGTLTSTSSSVAILTGSGSSVLTWAIAIFPASDISALTQLDWEENVEVKLFVTGS